MLGAVLVSCRLSFMSFSSCFYWVRVLFLSFLVSSLGLAIFRGFWGRWLFFVFWRSF